MLSENNRCLHRKGSPLISPEKFLLPEADGLLTRESQDYVLYKLNALKFYVNVVNKAMRDKWSERYFIDLQAGYGKNAVGAQIYLGSPLIALMADHPATHFWFNDNNPACKSALEQRVSASPIHERVEISQRDVNEVVTDVCTEIRHRDGKKRSLN